MLQPGSLVRWHYRLRLPPGASDAEVQAKIEAANKAFPQAGWEIRSRTNASPQLQRSIARFAQYLALVGLTALFVGGIGVANSAKHHLDRKRDVIATMKAVGATGARVVAVYFVEVMMLAGIGIAIGLAIGAALPFAVAAILGATAPLPISPAIDVSELAIAAAYGALTAACFALWPLGRAHDVPVAALFRDEVAPERRLPRGRYMICGRTRCSGACRACRDCRLRSQDRDHLHRRGDCGGRNPAGDREPGDGGSRPGAAAAFDRCCASRSPTSIGQAP